jgi:hypothetical protein
MAESATQSTTRIVTKQQQYPEITATDPDDFVVMSGCGSFVCTDCNANNAELSSKSAFE